MATRWVETSASSLRAELARSGRKKSDLARALGLSPAAVTRRLQGETPMDVNELCTVAEWLDVPVSVLLLGSAYQGPIERSWGRRGAVPEPVAA